MAHFITEDVDTGKSNAISELLKVRSQIYVPSSFMVWFLFMQIQGEGKGNVCSVDRLNPRGEKG